MSPLTAEENTAYFATRPRASQLGAWASPQSQVVASRAELDRRYDAAANRFPELQDVPVPPHWGGYLVVPDLVEFWQGRRGRMHDRLRYRRTSATDGAGTGPSSASPPDGCRPRPACHADRQSRGGGYRHTH